MSNKKNGAKESAVETQEPFDELSNLRAIIFGTAEQNLIEETTKLRTDTEQLVMSIDKSLSERISALQEKVDSQIAEIDERILFIDKTHDSNEAVLRKSLDNLYSEHEMFTSTTQQDIKNVNQSLDDESASLTNNFDQQLQQLKAHLEQVSNELSTSKTDRKTLAKLLATMATNLEDDKL